MARICEITGIGPRKGSIIWRSGKAKKAGGIGTHVTAITKRRFLPNLQRVKAVIDGERGHGTSKRSLKFEVNGGGAAMYSAPVPIVRPLRWPL